MSQQVANDCDDLKSNDIDDLDVKSNVIDFEKVKATLCTSIDIHNRLLFSWHTLFIDIRSEKEYQQSHIKQSINIPLDSDEDIVIKSLQKALNTKTKHIIIDIYCYSNKYLMQNKLDTKWYKYIHKILYNKFSDIKGYQFGIFNILDIDYETFINKYMKLINFDNSEMSDVIDQYPSIIIEDKLLMGGALDAESREIMRDYGITHIVNVTFECDNDFEDDKDLNIKYLQFALTDSPNTNIADKFNQCIDFIENALNANNGNNNNCLLVHCFAGISRSSSVVIAYFMKTQNMTFEDALEFIKTKRRIVEPNKGFAKQLKMWEKKGYK